MVLRTLFNCGILRLFICCTVFYLFGMHIGRSQGFVIEQVTQPFLHGESPDWDHSLQVLYFVDIYNQNIHRLEPETGEVTTAHIADGLVPLVVTVNGSRNQLVAAVGLKVALITWDSDKNSTDPGIETLADLSHSECRILNGTRLNDGKVDSCGRLWAGTMGPLDGSDTFVVLNQGSFYFFGHDLVPRKKITPVSLSNGLAWNSDDTVFYYIDSPTRKIVAYDYDARRAIISNKRTVFDLNTTNFTGIPDGMTIDTDNNLWCALFGGARVLHIDPIHGRLLRSIELPSKDVTSVAFGGGSLDILYVTTSRFFLTDAEIDEQPQSGSVFAVKGLGVRGCPSNSLALNGRRS